jgi:response regulator of citrate/malate metabolism
MMILTSLTDAEILRDAWECGATDVLILPITAEQLAGLLRRHLHRRKSA